MMILKGIGFAILGIGLFLLVAYVAMRLWNWLIPSLFNGPRLRFLQALGLFFLIRLLIGVGPGRFGHYGYGRPFWHHSWGPHHKHWPDTYRSHQRLKPVLPTVPDQH